MIFTGTEAEAFDILVATADFVASLEETFNKILGQIKDVRKQKVDIDVKIEALNYQLRISSEMLRKTALWPDEMRLYKPLGFIFVSEDLVTIRTDIRSERNNLLTRIHSFHNQLADLDQTLFEFKGKLRQIIRVNLRMREQQRMVNLTQNRMEELREEYEETSL